MARQLTYRDGAEVSVEITGTGQPIVFLHGWGANSKAFHNQTKHFGQTHQVIAFDFRGHGSSHDTSISPTIDILANDVIEVFEQLDLTDAVCVCWSMGAMVTWNAMFNLGLSSRLAGLVIVDMTPCIWNEGSWTLGIKGAKDQTSLIRGADPMRHDWPAAVEQFVPRIFAPDRTAQTNQIINEMISETKTLNPVVLTDLWESLAQQDFRENMADIKVPLWVAYGEQSKFYTSDTSEFIVANAQYASLTGFAKSGHAPHLEEPILFNQKLQEFLDNIAP